MIVLLFCPWKPTWTNFISLWTENGRSKFRECTGTHRKINRLKIGGIAPGIPGKSHPQLTRGSSPHHHPCLYEKIMGKMGELGELKTMPHTTHSHRSFFVYQPTYKFLASLQYSYISAHLYPTFVFGLNSWCVLLWFSFATLLIFWQ